jgi:hypothetical protein
MVFQIPEGSNIVLTLDSFLRDICDLDTYRISFFRSMFFTEGLL